MITQKFCFALKLSRLNVGKNEGKEVEYSRINFYRRWLIDNLPCDFSAMDTDNRAVYRVVGNVQARV